MFIDKKIFCTLLAGAVFLFTFFQTSSAYEEKRLKPMSEYEDVQKFINDISKKNRLDKKIVEEAFKNSYFDYSVIDLMEKPAEKRPWKHYSDMLISKDRVNKGKKYMRAHSKALANASKKYGVPKNVLTAIAGIESNYGSAPFKRTAVQSLGTLAFEYPRRSQYFQSELENIFILADKENVNPLTYYGSYAGAVGIAQFMPSNIIKYGKDGDGDGHIDIVNNHSDAIASIGNYLHEHGWQKGKDTAAFVTVPKNISDSLFANSPCDEKKRKTVKQWRKLGVKFKGKHPESARAVLSRLDEDNDKFTYAAFFENACPIHKYNNSLKYTAAISLLAKKLSDEK